MRFGKVSLINSIQMMKFYREIIRKWMSITLKLARSSTSIIFSRISQKGNFLRAWTQQIKSESGKKYTKLTLSFINKNRLGKSVRMEIDGVVLCRSTLSTLNIRVSHSHSVNPFVFVCVFALANNLVNYINFLIKMNTNKNVHNWILIVVWSVAIGVATVAVCIYCCHHHHFCVCCFASYIANSDQSWLSFPPLRRMDSNLKAWRILSISRSFNFRLIFSFQLEMNVNLFRSYNQCVCIYFARAHHSIRVYDERERERQNITTMRFSVFSILLKFHECYWKTRVSFDWILWYRIYTGRKNFNMKNWFVQSN